MVIPVVVTQAGRPAIQATVTTPEPSQRFWAACEMEGLREQGACG